MIREEEYIALREKLIRR